MKSHSIEYIQNYIGRRYGKLTIEAYSETIVYSCSNGSFTYHDKVQCICDCGIIKIIFLKNILAGRSTSCSCNYNKYYVGEKIGYLTVTKTPTEDKPRVIECKCVCGDVREYWRTAVLRGSDRSCGCIRNAKGPHTRSTYSGITFSKKNQRWIAISRKRDGKKHIGSFKTKQEAQMAIEKFYQNMENK